MGYAFHNKCISIKIIFLNLFLMLYFAVFLLEVGDFVVASLLFKLMKYLACRNLSPLIYCMLLIIQSFYEVVGYMPI